MPQIILVTGNAGTGKSTVLIDICDRLEEAGIGVFRTTFNNINAIHIQGNTSASTFPFHSSKTCASELYEMKPHELEKFMDITGIQRGIEGGTQLLLFDEISNYAPFHIAQLDYGCRQATGIEDRPFGGLKVIFAGDLFQLGPVRAGLGLCDALLELSKRDHLRMVRDYNALQRYKKNKIDVIKPDDERFHPRHPFSEGASVFSEAKWFHLNEQTRAIDDPVHTKTVENLGTGGSLALSDLDIYQRLSQEDVKEEKWLRAPMITATNHERLLLTHKRSIELGKFLGKKVIRWRSNVIQSNSKTAHLETNDPAYFEYFLQSADAYLTANIHRKLGLVNALKVRMHSVVPADQFDKELLQKAENGTLEDDVCTLTNPPAYVNVEIPPATLRTLPRRAANYLAKNNLQVPGGGVVIPIATFTGGNRKPVQVFPLEQPLNLACDAWVLPHFPVEMAFAITVNKAEGQTLKDGVIVAISQRARFNFSHAALYVALSRVEKSVDMRLLVSGMTEEQKQDSLLYLEKLRPKPSVPALFTGYGGTWSESDWASNEYSSVNAVAHLTRRH